MFHPAIFWKISTSNKFHFYTCASKHKLKLTLFHDSLLMILVRLDKNKMLPQVGDTEL